MLVPPTTMALLRAVQALVVVLPVLLTDRLAYPAVLSTVCFRFAAQVLSRDIRSLHQRRDVAPVTMQQPQQQRQESLQQTQQQKGVQQQDSSQHQAQEQKQQQEQEMLFAQQPDAGAVQQLQYSVTLDGVEVSYTISDSGHVTVLGAAASNV